MDFPIPKCRFCGNELIFVDVKPIDIQRWSCQFHYNIPVAYFLCAEYYDLIRLDHIEVKLNINQSIFIWTIFPFEYCDTLTRSESGLVCGFVHSGEFITAQDFFASFYHQPNKASPEQMESELKLLSNE